MKSFIVSLLLILSYQTSFSSQRVISVVGSSTVYPFSTVASERFSQITNYKAPKVEAIGSGGGLVVFCSGVGPSTPDIANTSRRIKKSEQDSCAKNGVTDIIEVKIGYDGIVVAQSFASTSLALTHKDVFLALAKHVVKEDGSLVENSYKTWKDVNPNLPDVKIRVFGPSPSSGTRDAFAELVLEEGCKDSSDYIKELKKTDKKKFKAICHSVREDGVYVEVGENDNLIIQKLGNDENALGVFGFSFLDQNLDKIKAVSIEGVSPDFENISDGSYSLSRALYFYIKKAHLVKDESLLSFVNFFISEDVMGDEGILVDRGLIPLSLEEYDSVVSDVEEKQVLPQL